jgi:hypothetical protein
MGEGFSGPQGGRWRGGMRALPFRLAQV